MAAEARAIVPPRTRLEAAFVFWTTTKKLCLSLSLQHAKHAARIAILGKLLRMTALRKATLSAHATNTAFARSFRPKRAPSHGQARVPPSRTSLFSVQDGTNGTKQTNANRCAIRTPGTPDTKRRYANQFRRVRRLCGVPSCRCGKHCWRTTKHCYVESLVHDVLNRAGRDSM
jgi:hypothetical protein